MVWTSSYDSASELYVRPEGGSDVRQPDNAHDSGPMTRRDLAASGGSRIFCAQVSAVDLLSPEVDYPYVRSLSAGYRTRQHA